MRRVNVVGGSVRRPLFSLHCLGWRKREKREREREKERERERERRNQSLENGIEENQKEREKGK